MLLTVVVIEAVRRCALRFTVDWGADGVGVERALVLGVELTLGPKKRDFQLPTNPDGLAGVLGVLGVEISQVSVRDKE